MIGRQSHHFMSLGDGDLPLDAVVLPQEAVSVYPHQVGGKSHKSKTCNDVLLYQGCILKPLQLDRRGENEERVYRAALEQQLPLLKHMAPFYGAVSVVPSKGSQQGVRYLALSDMTQGFSKPSIVDVKIGRQTWDDAASAEKIQREKAKFAYQAELRFRFVGFKVYDAVSRQYRVLDKSYGRSLTPNTIQDALRVYLPATPRHAVYLAQIRAQLSRIIALMGESSTFQLISTSLLMVYEGDAAVLNPLPASVTMIDFAHAAPLETPCVDTNYLDGVRSLSRFMEAYAAASGWS